MLPAHNAQGVSFVYRSELAPSTQLIRALGTRIIKPFLLNDPFDHISFDPTTGVINKRIVASQISRVEISTDPIGAVIRIHKHVCRCREGSSITQGQHLFLAGRTLTVENADSSVVYHIRITFLL